MLKYIIEEPYLYDCDINKIYKYPFICTEILTRCNLDKII